MKINLSQRRGEGKKKSQELTANSQQPIFTIKVKNP
jgi:hypothetical protein